MQQNPTGSNSPIYNLNPVDENQQQQANFVQASTISGASVKEQLRNKKVIYVITVLIIIAFVTFVVGGVVSAVFYTGDFLPVVGLLSFAPIGYGAYVTAKTVNYMRNKPPLMIEVIAKVIGIEKEIIPGQNIALFYPVLSYVFNGNIITSTCKELGQQNPTMKLNDAVRVPIHTDDPHLFWINEKPKETIPPKLYLGLGLIAVGLLMLFIPVLL